MLEKCCLYCHNYFVRAAYPGSYTISSGTIDLSALLKEGQRFWLVGSDLNDGVYTWHAAGIKNDDDAQAVTLKDEEFAGTILAMAPPKEFFELAAEISAWQTAYGAQALSPYQSENVIGVYSYTKAQLSGDESTGTGAPTWQSVFKNRLLPYMKTGMLL